MVDAPVMDAAAERERMVERQIAARGVSDRRLLDAMRTVPREEFVPEHIREFAFEDSPLPIEAEQTISQPYIVALMIEAAGLKAGDRVRSEAGRVGRECVSTCRSGGARYNVKQNKK